MRKASTVLLEQGTQTPSPAPDLIPAETLTENLHWDWYRKRGHFTVSSQPAFLKRDPSTHNRAQLVMKDC